MRVHSISNSCSSSLCVYWMPHRWKSTGSRVKVVDRSLRQCMQMQIDSRIQFVYERRKTVRTKWANVVECI